MLLRRHINARFGNHHLLRASLQLRWSRHRHHLPYDPARHEFHPARGFRLPLTPRLHAAEVRPVARGQRQAPGIGPHHDPDNNSLPPQLGYLLGSLFRSTLAVTFREQH